MPLLIQEADLLKPGLTREREGIVADDAVHEVFDHHRDMLRAGLRLGRLRSGSRGCGSSDCR